MTNVKQIVDFCAEHKIDLEQFLYLYLFASKDYCTSAKFGNEVKNKIDADLVADLVESGYVQKSNLYKDYHANPSKPLDYIDAYELTKEFEILMLIKTDIAAREIWDLYPSSMEINGKLVSSYTISFEEFEEMYRKRFSLGDKLKSYIKIIKGKRKIQYFNNEFVKTKNVFMPAHKKNLEAVDKYKKMVKAGQVNEMGIEKFFTSEMYNIILDKEKFDATVIG